MNFRPASFQSELQVSKSAMVSSCVIKEEEEEEEEKTERKLKGKRQKEGGRNSI